MSSLAALSRIKATPRILWGGGATVEIQDRPQNTSALRWHGSYRPRLHPMAPAALVFVRLYFLRTFFARLEQKLREYEVAFHRHSPQEQPRG